MKYISDEIYHRISFDSYENIPKEIELKTSPEWKTIEPEGALLHDTNGSGFDAIVYYNSKTDQVIIGYRGTEPGYNWGKVKDLDADTFDVVGGRIKKLEEQKQLHPEWFEKPSLWPPKTSYQLNEQRDLRESYKSNQFRQAEELYRTIKEEYPGAQISTTGHSLGGGLAEYVAVRNGISSVSYNAPSILPTLSDDLVEQIKQGAFLKTNISYVKPEDPVGGGPFKPWEHVGSTYYVDNNYATANEKYQDPTNRIALLSIPSVQINSMGWPYIQFDDVTIDVPEYGHGAINKIKDFLKKDGNHALVNFKFDNQTGNISNQLYTTDGQFVSELPRVRTYEEAQAALKDLVSDLLHQYGGSLGSIGQIAAAAMGTTIQLRPEALQAAGQTMRRHVQEFQIELPRAINTIQHLIQSSRSSSLQPIAQKMFSDLNNFNRWYGSNAKEIADFINKKAEAFIQADKG
ncbi:lipase family protein [Paenibacillus glacialis]|uniref:triacylglycerol lipase n=1 Tax=Paenibacillus glacialis TaxID=494026 RepID=A0A168HQF6_9BACL|nr:hypothetical protein [Paenibacillus glacialis]OAB38425.1 hypothetical protein PGLA_20245 [Paenibacillus glacialis]